MKNQKNTIIIIILLISFFTACTINIPLNPEFLEEENKTVGIALIEYPPISAHKYGGTGMVDILLNESLAMPLQEYLNEYDISSFTSIKTKMQNKINAMGMKSVNINEFINVQELPEIEETEEIDYTSIKQKYNVDYILLISISRIGTVRKYMGFIPLGNPDAICQVNGELINLENNKSYWAYHMKETEAVVEPERPWNTPPDYENLGIALNTAIHKSIDFMVDNFAE